MSPMVNLALLLALLAFRVSAITRLATFRDDVCGNFLASVDTSDIGSCENELGGSMSFKINQVPPNCTGQRFSSLSQ